jgi:hypothetical protein
MGGMPRLLTRRLGPVGAALTLWDVWRRLPPKQRRWVVQQARTHGPRMVKQAMDSQRTRRSRRP